jgi:5-methylcytosine-specific restriction enzyme subunit McrC
VNIPIENIYYLLCYAWDKLEEKDRVSVSIDSKSDVLNLLAKVLINSVKMLLKRGVDRQYISHTEERSGIKGKLQISETLKRNSLSQQRAVCTFDELSANITSNRIIVTTCALLIRTKGVDKDLQSELRTLHAMLPGIDPIELRPAIFSTIRLNRNNRFYGFVLNTCELISENILPSEENGRYQFSDFTRDERKMNRLYESFIKNFYRVEQKKFTTVKSENIYWDFDEPSIENARYLPRMLTDITLENHDEKIIIDAKYYRETMAKNFDKEKVKSNNLYQLFSYLMNQEDGSEKTSKAVGILLYPTTEGEYDLNYKYKNHSIRIHTLNLNSSWKDISNRLLGLISSEAVC